MKGKKKKEFKIPSSQVDSDIDKQYQQLKKEGWLCKPKKEIIEGIEYLVYKRTKKAEKYFQNSKKKELR